MNVVCLMGRLTADPEIRKTQNGISMCRFSVAINRQFQGANGERQTDFINCVAWRQTADFISRYFRKGNMIGLSGSIQTGSYVDKETGKNRTSFDVVVNNAYFAESKNNTQSTSNYSSDFSGDFSKPSPKQAENNFSSSPFSTGFMDGFSAVDDDDGDLPF